MSAVTGINWASYLVNVQILRLSFLRPEEPQQLITQPVPDFASQKIFKQDIVNKVIKQGSNELDRCSAPVVAVL
jgi:hypothetical protein